MAKKMQEKTAAKQPILLTQLPEAELMAAITLYDEPLFKYADGKELHMLVIGTGDTAQQMVRMALMCGQMLDHTLHIDVLAKDIKAFREALLAGRPALTKYVSIDGAKCAGKCLANVTLKDVAGLNSGRGNGAVYDMLPRNRYIVVDLPKDNDRMVQTLLKKISALAVDVICPLHGPALHAPLDRYLQLYSTWASYQVEEDGTLIACSSIYGNTTKAAQLLAEKLRARTGKPVVVYDLARCDVYAAIADAFRFPRLVLACASYNADIFPPMRPFLQGIAERGYQGRTVALMENGTWAPSAAKVMRRMLEGCKTLTFAEHTVTIQSALNDTSAAQLEALADELAQQ